MGIDNKFIERKPLTELNELIQKYEYLEKQLSREIERFINNELRFNSPVSNQTTAKHTELFRPVRYGNIVPAAYIIRHNTEGRVYVGATGNINARISGHESKLRAGTHSVTELQNAYATDPNIQPFFILTSTVVEAFDIEQWLLDRYMDSGILYNRRIEAYILKGYTHSHATRLKLSQSHTGKKRDRISVTKSAESQFNPVIVENTRYRSVKDAAAAHSISTGLAVFRLQSSNFTTWNYDPPREKKLKTKTSQKQSIIYNDVNYPTMTDAARAAKCSLTKIRKHLADGNQLMFRKA